MAEELCLRDQLDFFLNERLEQIVISNPRKKEAAQKIRIRPLSLRGELVFQAEELRGKQAFHRNMPKDEALEYIGGAVAEEYKQLELRSGLGTMQVLVSKAGKQTVKVKKTKAFEKRPAGEGTAKIQAAPGARRGGASEGGFGRYASLEHNRRKRYILEEGRPVPFLIDLGVMTGEGKVVRAYYDKFRQINRFLEFIEDILPELPKDREIRIIDFGWGKSYLTFAMYYYFRELRGCDARITGLDLKQEVIEHCGRLAEKYGYEKLQFLHGDIAEFNGAEQADMVVTLHACDTATDYALAKAVGWNASVILSVPCCQHELNRQIGNDLMKPVFRYGIVKERMAALYTDALRAEILENHGYRTQILEFIEMEHTPKNLLLRCVREGRRKENQKEIRALVEFLGADPTLLRLLGLQGET